MNANDWKTIKSLFDELVELTPEQQHHRLQRLEHSNDILCEVRKMLKAESEQSERPGLRTLVMNNANQLLNTQLELNVGDQVGSYTISEVIGEGGMGVVFKATRADQQFDHQVAIKITRQKLLHSLTQQSFEHNVLAQLKHPNIAHIYDAGVTVDDHAFIIMELIEGVDLATYCQRHQLSIPKRLELFSKIANAVQYAHQKGIIHRDLKPQNILIATDGDQAEPKLIDFGIAEQQLDSDISEGLNNPAGLGTPAYMSPEQLDVNQQADTRSDVYALGLVLCELLSGINPFIKEGASVEDVFAQKKQPALKISHLFINNDKQRELAYQRELSNKQLRHLLNFEFDALIAKAIHLRPEERYASVAELTFDIQRWQQGYPINALPSSTSYQLKKFLKRNRFSTAVAAMVTIMLISATGVSLWSLDKERKALAKAQQELEKSEAVSQFISDIFASVDPREKGINVKVIDLLDDAEKKLAAFTEAQDDVKVQLHFTLGRSHKGLRNFTKAETNLNEALKLLQKKYPRSSVEVIQLYTELAELESAKGEHQKALDISNENLAIARKHLGNAHAETMSNLNNASVNLLYVGMKEDDMEKKLQSVKMAEELLALRIKVLGVNHEDTSFTRNNLANYYGIMNNYDKAYQHFSDNYVIQKKIFGEDSYYTLDTMRNLGHIYYDRKQYDKAAEMFLRSFEGQLKIQKLETPITLFTAISLMETYLKLGKRDYAANVARQMEAPFRSGVVEREGINSKLKAFMVEVLGE
ncbi:serine/threonine-protein kinase [Pleionea sp. CnH1-48]|uniref:serine/threonine-protein kinase n=1 Tax=Pleionea sp. CnH1-48 TaxID=2954494 RepID=UPI0020972C7A|nr:serine/threonine-protein kinase [Pleionea sp. CnH1-48]MCO7223145.1 serine/threonine-protein kinase [Pleionea sp. CnH1-48]